MQASLIELYFSPSSLADGSCPQGQLLIARGGVLLSPPERSWNLASQEEQLVGQAYSYTAARGNASLSLSLSTATAFATRAEAVAWAHETECRLNLARQGTLIYRAAWCENSQRFLIEEEWDCLLTASGAGNDPEISAPPNAAGHMASARMNYELILTNRRPLYCYE